MKKLTLLICFIVSVFCVTQSASALEECSENVCPLPEEVTTVEEKKVSEEEIELQKFFEKYEQLQNKHNLNVLKRVYADDFVDTDGFNKSQLFDLMAKTYVSYPDMTNIYKIDSISVTGDYAMVYVSQTVKATTKSPSQITGDKGEYSANLNNIFYLRRANKIWKIYSEAVTYENSVLAYGMAKEVETTLNVPQKVFSGTNYSAGVSVNIPEGYSAIGSVNNTQIVTNYASNKETFRQVPVENSSLERVLTANNKNNNEAVVVSIGFTQLNNDLFKKKKIDIAGLLMLMKRVDIVPAHVKEDKTAENQNDKK